MLRRVVKETGQTRGQPAGGGEERRASSRERDLRSWKEAIDKGYRNSEILERLKK